MRGQSVRAGTHETRYDRRKSTTLERQEKNIAVYARQESDEGR